MKEGDRVRWTREGSTTATGVIVGKCRIYRARVNGLCFLVLFTGAYSFAEPFAIPETELRLLSPLELLGATAD